MRWERLKEDEEKESEGWRKKSTKDPTEFEDRCENYDSVCPGGVVA